MHADHMFILEISWWLRGVLSKPFGRNILAVLLTLALTPCCMPTKAASALSVRVQGNQLVDGDGNFLRLLGVNRSGSEYKCVDGDGIFDGPVDSTAIAAIKAWHINAVRVPLNEDCWLGINLPPSNQYVGVAYQDAIVAFVQALNDDGIYAILDLHWNAPGTYVSNQQQPMADLDHAPAFWSSVAATFKDFPAVIFDLYGEPDVADWSCWLNGCTVSTYEGTWSTAGMAQLVAAVRGTGATQPIMLGGLNYAADLSQWLAYLPSDSLQPPQLVAGVHSYCGSYSDMTVAECQAALSDNQRAQWPAISTVAKSVPVVTGEFGEYDCATTYVTPYMAFADSIGASYLGWAWDAYGCNSFPALIADYAGTATAYGIGLKTHLAALNKIHDAHDFNGDGYSDIAWRNANGDTAIWLMGVTSSGNAQILSTTDLGIIPNSRQIVGQRDFNGDGNADLLWSNSNGDTGIWLMNGAQVSQTADLGVVPSGWSIVGTGDFNGDGYGDILWRNTNGDTAIWLMTGTATQVQAAAMIDLGVVPTSWNIVRTGDFNGDGYTDILWQSANGDTGVWLMTGAATQVQMSSWTDFGVVSTSWNIAGTGDFNGDGYTDILWRSTNGDTAIWLMAWNGSEVLMSSSNDLGVVPAGWNVAVTGDFNGDGRSDILWGNSDGDTAIWFMNGGVVLSISDLGIVPNGWAVQGAGAD
jgi:Cellulase (glycosyl hydrolase family 5)/FG-GAP-like repeat